MDLHLFMCRTRLRDMETDHVCVRSSLGDMLTFKINIRIIIIID